MVTKIVYKYLFWSALLATVVLSLLPLSASQLSVFSWQDKLHHFIAYAVLCYFAIKSFGRQYSFLQIGLAIAIFGLLVEFAQSLTSHRLGDIYDLIANIAGVLTVALWFFWRGN
jgi:VanZ family protein